MSAGNRIDHAVRRAAPGEAASMTSLALRSKASWGYSEEFMTACRDELTYTEAQIDAENFEFWVCEAEEQIAGFYALELLAVAEAELEAMFVEPALIGRGIGRALIEHAKMRAGRLGLSRLVIQADPNAAEFYQAAGALLTGERESGSIPGRFLPVFQIEL